VADVTRREIGGGREGSGDSGICDSDLFCCCWSLATSFESNRGRQLTTKKYSTRRWIDTSLSKFSSTDTFLRNLEGVEEVAGEGGRAVRVGGGDGRGFRLEVSWSAVVFVPLVGVVGRLNGVLGVVDCEERLSAEEEDVVKCILSTIASMVYRDSLEILETPSAAKSPSPTE
jgi:hypothetical protein